jgi:hypothetical protein
VHPDATICLRPPGTGEVTAAIMLAGMGEDRDITLKITICRTPSLTGCVVITRFTHAKQGIGYSDVR